MIDVVSGKPSSGKREERPRCLLADSRRKHQEYPFFKWFYEQ
jgi:hypothetical protein